MRFSTVSRLAPWTGSVDHGLKLIDNSLRCMVSCLVVNQAVRYRLTELRLKGWTLANIARKLELSPVTIESWSAGTRSPANPKSVLESLERLAKLKRIPKRRPCSGGNRKAEPGRPNKYGPGARTEGLVGCARLDKEAK